MTIEVNWFKASQLEQFNNPVRDSSEGRWCLRAWGDGAECQLAEAQAQALRVLNTPSALLGKSAHVLQNEK